MSDEQKNPNRMNREELVEEAERLQIDTSELETNAQYAEAIRLAREAAEKAEESSDTPETPKVKEDTKEDSEDPSSSLPLNVYRVRGVLVDPNGKQVKV